MAGTTPNRSYTYPQGTDGPAGMTQIETLAEQVDTDMAKLLNTLTYVTLPSGGMNPNISGTAQVVLVGKMVFAKLALTYNTTAGGSTPGNWPNTQVTAFTLPDTTYAPSILHRMSMAGPFQATAGTVTLVGNPGSTAVYAGANGTTAGPIYWDGLLWRTD